MYNVTDSMYTREDLADGQAQPAPLVQVNAIHAIFQKMQQKQFDVPNEHKNNPVKMQAKLKKEAIQACRNDLNNHWGITKFFIFLLHLTPFKFGIEKKADAILRDTGRLYQKGRELGCTDVDKKGYVNALNENWINRTRRAEIINNLPGRFKPIYQNPDASLEEFLVELDEASKSERMLVKEILSTPNDEAHPFNRLLNYKTKDILDIEKEAFEHTDLNIDENISDQIEEFKDEQLKQLLLDLPDGAHHLHLAVLNEYSERFSAEKDKLSLSDEEKKAVATKLYNVYKELGSRDFPFKLINDLGLEKEENIKNLKYHATIKKGEDKFKIDPKTQHLDTVLLDKQKELESLAEKNDTQALLGALNSVKDEDKVNYLDVLTKLLGNKERTDFSRMAMSRLFEKLSDEQKIQAFSLLSRNEHLSYLLTPEFVNKLNNNEVNKPPIAYLQAFKKLVETAPKGFVKTDLVNAILLKMTPDERGKAIGFILSKPNPFLFLSLDMVQALDEKEKEIPYVKIAELFLNQNKVIPKQKELFKLVLERMDEEDRSEIFQKMVNNKSFPILFTQITSDTLIDSLNGMKESFLKRNDAKSLIETNVKYADLLLASGGIKEIHKLYKVTSDEALVKELGKNKERLGLLKFLIVREAVNSTLLADNIDDFSDEVQKLIRNDNRLKEYTTREAK